MRRAASSAVAVVVGIAAGLGTASAQDVDFERHVLPILEGRCFECHRASYVDERGRRRNPKGGLRLDGRAWILRGGDGGAAIVAGDPDESLLYSLVALPAEDPDIMPEKGEPLSRRDQDVLRRWIAGGAAFGEWVGAPGPAGASDAAAVQRVPSRTQLLTELGRGLGAAPSGAIDVARNAGAAVEPVFPGSPLLRVGFLSREAEVDDRVLERLSGLRGHVAILELGRTRVTDRALGGIAKMPRLVHLDLARTTVSDRGIRQLASAPAGKSLRVLNLYGAKVGDEVVGTLAELPKLRAVYLWDTGVTDAGAAALARRRSDLKIQHARVLPGAVEGRASGNGRRQGADGGAASRKKRRGGKKKG